jgi:hypothetical protein
MKEGCGLPPSQDAADDRRDAVSEFDVHELQDYLSTMLSDVAKCAMKRR